MSQRHQFIFEDSLDIEKAMTRLPGKSEELANKVIHNQGTKEMIQRITGFMPIGVRKNDRHAALSNSLKDSTFNLGFEVYARGGAANTNNSFGYLVFPNEGRGKRNPVAQQFFEKGAEKANEKILTDVLQALEDAHDQTI